MVIEPGNNSINTHSASSSRAKAPAREENSVEKTDAKENVSQDDSVSLSSAGQAIVKLEAEIAKTPDVDLEKVEKVKAEIASGRYSVNSSSVADRMLDQDSVLG